MNDSENVFKTPGFKNPMYVSVNIGIISPKI